MGKEKTKDKQKEYPICDKECFARENGKCTILLNTDFGGRECPFRKKHINDIAGK